MRFRLSSLKVTSVLLGLIAGAAVLGTLIAQGQEPEFYTLRYGAFWGWAVRVAGADRLYASVPFVSLLCLLAVNLAACLIRSGRIHLAAGGTKRVLVLLHAGILVLCVGSGISAAFREEKFYQLLPGQRLVFPQAGAMVEVKEFDVVFYPGTDQPQEFRTVAHVHWQERAMQERLIRVNYPLTVGTHTVYQSSFELVGKARLSVRRADTELWRGWIATGDEVTIPGPEEVTLRLDACLPDVLLTPDSGVRSRSYRLRNPGVLIAVYKQGALVERFWWDRNGVLARETPEYAIVLIQTDLVYATIFKTVKDPGFLLVGVGFAVVCLAAGWYVWQRERELAPAPTNRGYECSD